MQLMPFMILLFMPSVSMSLLSSHSRLYASYPCAPPSASFLVSSCVSLTALNVPCPILTTSSTSRFFGIAWVMNIIVTLIFELDDGGGEVFGGGGIEAAGGFVED